MHYKILDLRISMHAGLAYSYFLAAPQCLVFRTTNLRREGPRTTGSGSLRNTKNDGGRLIRWLFTASCTGGGVVLSPTEVLQLISENTARADAKITTERKHDVNGFCKVLKCMRWIYKKMCLQRRAPQAAAAAWWVGEGVLRVTGERMILFHDEMFEKFEMIFFWWNEH